MLVDHRHASGLRNGPGQAQQRCDPIHPMPEALPYSIRYHARYHNPSLPTNFPSWLSRQRGEGKDRATRLWKVLPEIVPNLRIIPFSLCVPPPWFGEKLFLLHFVPGGCVSLRVLRYSTRDRLRSPKHGTPEGTQVLRRHKSFAIAQGASNRKREHHKPPDPAPAREPRLGPGFAALLGKPLGLCCNEIEHGTTEHASIPVHS